MFNLQIVAGVEHIHSHKYVHRDLKLENVFLNEQLRAKIGDFGMAAKIRNDLPRKSFCGTPNYMARKLERTILKTRLAEKMFLRLALLLSI